MQIDKVLVGFLKRKKELQLTNLKTSIKITFVDPPNYKTRNVVEKVFGCNFTIYPIPNVFTLTIAAILKLNGFQVGYIDAANSRWSQRAFRKFLANDDSNVLSIHSVNLSKESDLDSFKEVRRIRPDTSIIFTGPCPTLEPRSYLHDENTFVIRGEPEFTFLELVDRISKDKHSGNFFDIKGLSFLSRNGIVDNPPRGPIEDLDILPFPAREFLDNRLYFNPKMGLMPWTVMLTSRGCSFRCIFCVPCSLSFAREIEYKRFYGKKPPVRMRSAKNVIEEFKLLNKEGCKAVSIVDDNFLLEEERVVKICEGIKDLGIAWGCLGRADLITEGIAKAMAQAGCRYVDIGIESFEQRVLDYVKKDLRVEDILKAIEILKVYNIDAKLNVLIGAAPFETEEMVLKNIEMVKKIRSSNVMFSIVSPFPGTEYYEICKGNNWFKYGDYVAANLQKKAIMNYPNLSSEKLERLVRKANYSVYLDPNVVWQGIKRARSPRAALGSLFAYMRKIRP